MLLDVVRNRLVQPDQPDDLSRLVEQVVEHGMEIRVMDNPRKPVEHLPIVFDAAFLEAVQVFEIVEKPLPRQRVLVVDNIGYLL